MKLALLLSVPTCSCQPRFVKVRQLLVAVTWLSVECLLRVTMSGVPSPPLSLWTACLRGGVLSDCFSVYFHLYNVCVNHNKRRQTVNSVNQ